VMGYEDYTEKIGESDAQIYYPKEGAGPFPVLVLSPGGQAETTRGYEGFGRWFASWGYVTVVVAFNTDTAEERADRYSTALDWLIKKNAEKEWKLAGKLDTTRFVSAGHSRGGAACIIAARKDKRFMACLAMAPSGPETIEGDNAPAVCLISGDLGDAEMCTTIFGKFAKPKHQVTVAGMDHFFNPQEKAMVLIKYSTAFLNVAVRGDARYRKFLTEKAEGVTVRSEE